MIKPRKQEFDLEHLESALEADVDFFMTSDKKLIKKLKHTRDRYKTVKEVNQALKICVSPNNLLEHLTKSRN